MGRRETLLEHKSMDSLRTVLAPRSLPCDCSSEGVQTTIYDPGGDINAGYGSSRRLLLCRGAR